MALPAIRAPLIPPLSPSASAADRDGFAPAEATPLHSRCAAADAAFFADERGAVELAKTDRPPCRAKPAVDPATRDWMAA